MGEINLFTDSYAFWMATNEAIGIDRILLARFILGWNKNVMIKCLNKVNNTKIFIWVYSF